MAPRSARSRTPLLFMCSLTALTMWGCEGRLAHNDESPDTQTPPDAVNEMGRDPVTPSGDMEAAAPDADMGAGGRDMAGEEMGGGMPVDRFDHPNAIAQGELFSCADPSAPRSSPVRLKRLSKPEWLAAMAFDDAGKVVLPDDDTLRYSTYVDDETIDVPVIDQYLRLGALNGRWTIAGSSSAKRSLQMQRPGGSIVTETVCFQDTRRPDDACIEGFVRALLRVEVQHKEPSDEAVARLVAFAKAQIAEETYSASHTIATRNARHKTIDLMVQAAWMTHEGLFRREIGEEAGDGTERRKLTDEEIAGALALALTDYGPNHPLGGYSAEEGVPEYRLEPLQQALREGNISDRAKIAELVRYYLAGTDPAAQYGDMPQQIWPPNAASDTFVGAHWISPKLLDFFQEWLDYADAGEVFKDELTLTTGFTGKRTTNSYRAGTFPIKAYQGGRLVSELDNVVSAVVAADEDVLETLLTTNRFLVRPMQVDPTLTERNAIYGMIAPYMNWVYNLDYDEVGAIADTPEARWVELPDRAGVLTHPAWLAAHGGNFDNDANIIYRGHWVWENLLCGWVDTLPVGVEAQLDPNQADKSGRVRVLSATENTPYCMNCHGAMNPFGLPFEQFTHAGYVRTSDRDDTAVDGSSTLQFTPVLHLDTGLGAYALFERTPGDTALEDGAKVNDVKEMMTLFSRSKHVKQCFVRQSFRYFMGRDETRADACTLQQMEQAYDDHHGSMVEMLVALFTSDTFLYRHIPAGEQEVAP